MNKQVNQQANNCVNEWKKHMHKRQKLSENHLPAFFTDLCPWVVRQKPVLSSGCVEHFAASAGRCDPHFAALDLGSGWPPRWGLQHSASRLRNLGNLDTWWGETHETHGRLRRNLQLCALRLSSKPGCASFTLQAIAFEEPLAISHTAWNKSVTNRTFRRPVFVSIIAQISGAGMVTIASLPMANMSFGLIQHTTAPKKSTKKRQRCRWRRWRRWLKSARARKWAQKASNWRTQKVGR